MNATKPLINPSLYTPKSNVPYTSGLLFTPTPSRLQDMILGSTTTIPITTLDWTHLCLSNDPIPGVKPDLSIKSESKPKQGTTLPMIKLKRTSDSITTSETVAKKRKQA